MYDQVTLKLNVDPWIISALKEDITSEDVSTNSVMPHPQAGEVDLICKEDGIICGLQVFERVFTLLDEKTTVEFLVQDGAEVHKGQLMAKVHGDIRTLLCGERTALNYLQRMSGIATYTHSVAELLKGTGIKLLDTRKTTPNNRFFYSACSSDMIIFQQYPVGKIISVVISTTDSYCIFFKNTIVWCCLSGIQKFDSGSF